MQLLEAILPRQQVLFNAFVPANSIEDSHTLHLRSMLNDETVLSDDPASMIFSTAKLISIISTDTTL